MPFEQNTNMKPTVILVGNPEIIKLGLIRSLGEDGFNIINVYLSNHKWRDLFRRKPIDYFSRYVSAFYLVNRKDLIDFLIKKISKRGHKSVILTVDDSTTFLLDKSYNQLKEYFLLANINQQEEGIIHSMDKYSQKLQAQKIGLNVAKGWVIPFIGGEYQIPQDLEYPCFIKGRYSYHNSKRIQQKCNDELELRSLLDTCQQLYPYDLIAEEYIPVDKEFGIIGACWDGQCVFPAIVEFLVMGNGSSNGVSMFGSVDSLDKNQQLSHQIHLFLLGLHYTGICNMDFIESQGKLFFVELNFRFASYGYAVNKAGINIPILYVNTLLKLDVAKLINIQVKKKYFYFNEKIGIRNVQEKYISQEQYNLLDKRADFCMVKSTQDLKPYIFFILTEPIVHIKMLLQTILSKFR